MSTRNILIGCGVILLLGVCVVTVAVGGFGLWAFMSPTAEPAIINTPGVVNVQPTQDFTQPTQQVPPPSLGAVPYQGVVQILALVDTGGGRLEVSWTGSGTIITPDGLILSNAHVVLPDKYYPLDALQVAMTIGEDQLPVPTYFAEVMQADPDLDIAVIRITTDLSGNPVDRATLNLPTVPLGNSDALRLGDPVTIIGYPGIGGDTITLTRGDVSGFTAEAGRGDRAFIKTSATIAGGNSGGLAANQNGEIIGVPTQLGYGGDDQYVDCRVLADTNRDGFIDEFDNCVPTGGFINALRPINLAMPFIDAAKRGEVFVGETLVEEIQVPSENGVLFFDDFSNPNSTQWDLGGNEDVYREVTNGEYWISVDPDNYYGWSNPYQYFGDVVVQVLAFPVTGTGEADYGVMCRYVDVDNFYALEISEDGFYTIWKYENGEFYDIVPWDNSAFVPTNGAPVTITASCVGNTLTLAVDGVIVAEAVDYSFSAGDVGLIAGTWDRPGLVMGFDDFVVFEP